jgi:hypothetical protein
VARFHVADALADRLIERCTFRLIEVVAAGQKNLVERYELEKLALGQVRSTGS